MLAFDLSFIFLPYTCTRYASCKSSENIEWARLSFIAPHPIHVEIDKL